MPIYLWNHGIDAFQLGMFVVFFFATGMSITLGYHRLFSHLTFHAHWSVKLFTLLFGAAAFEGSAVAWSADHRKHHKHVDHDEDPYDISKGLFFAHIGWLLFRTGPDTPLSWVRDLQKDRLAMWQHRHYVPLAFGMCFGVPALIGFAVGGWDAALGAFLLSGVARVVFVHHMTFCINSLCHWIGDRPYSSKCTARDSFLMAIFTFGEGYHNYHHEFQYDYRNGVKPWQYDPTKWAIWLLNKVGLVRNLRVVDEEKILKAQIAEQQILLSAKLEKRGAPVCESLQALLHAAQERMHEAFVRWEVALADWRAAAERRHELSREHRRELKRELDEATQRLRDALRYLRYAHEA
ncbi:MAG: fatty acid desaturase [Terrimicrobiaceae bacterium]|nr:fatty acid desaturase [Terrimicrobiaceae bacterium]